MTKIRDLMVFEELSIVHVNGFETEPDIAVDPVTGEEWDANVAAIDPPGSANFLCEQYGMAVEELRPPGILWTDYDSSSDEPYRFSVLVDGDEAEGLAKWAKEAGYEVIRVEPIADPTNFGDGHGTVEILKHRDGWVILES